VLAASFKTSGVFAVIILLALVGVSITWGMTWLENRLLRWR
jgi:NitT/TauT family transport system permease protein